MKAKRSVLNILAALAFSLSLTAQQQIHPVCGTEIPDGNWENWFQTKIKEYEVKNGTGKTTQTNYVIPVIVHVIHASSEAAGVGSNLKAQQVQAQIDALNDAMAGNAPGNSSLPAVFASVDAGNTNITFCLATKNLNGNIMAESGIDRIDWGARGWQDPAGLSNVSSYFDGTVKPASIWDPTKYFNIWVGDFFNPSTGGLIGYATFPIGTGLAGITGTGTSTTDGVVMASRCFGCQAKFANGYYSQAAYAQGITTVHEVGHWLGLRHISGDASCSNDYCNDTPPQSGGYNGCQNGLNWGCPSYPFQANLCSGNPNGEMFMNFMDYSDDGCRSLFTADQAARFFTALNYGTYRAPLLTSGVCNTSTYCNSTYIQSGNEHISNVAFNTINNSSGNNTSSGYEDFSSISTFVAKGTSHQLSVTVNTDGNWTYHCQAFFDWNDDKDFYDAGEMVDLGGITNVTSGVMTASVSIPTTAVIGTIRMRVNFEYNVNPGPCDADHTSEWGEAEDYSINITASVDCNGVVGGTAYLDNCGVCVGGNTGYFPCVAIADTTYQIKGLHSGKCLSNNGTGVAQFTCSDTLPEVWKFKQTQPGYYEIVSAQNGDKFKLSSMANGTALESCCSTQTSTDVLFRAEQGTGGAIRLVPQANMNKLLDMWAWSTSDGGPVTVWDRTLQQNQQWILMPVYLDCNNTPGGSAYYDSCGICAGGNTGILPILSSGACTTSLENVVLTSEIKLYPNPANNEVFIKIDAVHAGSATIEVYSLLGKLKYNNIEKLEAGESLKTITVKGWTSGVYYVKVRFEQGQFIFRLIVSN